MPHGFRRGVFALLLLAAATAGAEDGYDLWLRYVPVAPEWQARYRPAAATIVAGGDSATMQIAVAELQRGVAGLLGTKPGIGTAAGRGAIVIGTPAGAPAIAELKLPLHALGNEGYLLRTVEIDGEPATVIAANSDIGALYGAWHFLRLLQTGQPIDRLDIRDAPGVKLRLLNHWDNLDRTVERGYAGASLWDWWKLPDYKDPRYTDYARANASIGINGSVLNNVNSNAESLTARYLEKAAALADVFRPYGIRVYLSARFSAPMEIGGLDTADPLDPAVRTWWQEKAAEIYRAIPDFGGFLVKANSEGQPGPQDYGRNHADGANMLAKALAPHGGVVIWRAFVYSDERPEDRASQAYTQFTPLDGSFADNVVVQVKNGAIDFQPREPFHPLFGAMPETPLMMEFQITKEYLGFATHLAYLGTLFEETLAADTYAAGEGSTVARVIDGSLHGQRLTGMAGVANTGTDRNWSGSHFDQANWYAFGRFAWNPHRSARAIAEEWARMTFSNASEFVAPVVDMMMSSRETVVNYMTPLGLNHLMGSGHHYGPAPWVDDLGRADWNPVYFHRADRSGLGFDRTRDGSGAVAQYAEALEALYGDIETVPERYLLWFHHVPWDRRMASGRTLWDELVVRYSRGVEEVAAMEERWASLAPYVDAARHHQVAAFLRIQANEARWWRDACIAYFQTFARRPLPKGYAAPEHSLDWYRALQFPNAPGH
ncbi:MAG TPA: alpha-glucuronidase family glycosyl hydrolase [Woeseiaceae bacterium]|nr:alpha-glucuronidase family glycosyl hydrolase [Woeseiaceae bacterium]